jgi:hypothetical protein
LRALQPLVATLILLPLVNVLAASQTNRAPREWGLVGPATLSCSPAPCVLPPTQVSDGTYTFDAPIVSDPLDPRHLLLGSYSGSCPGDTPLGFYTSLNGGSSWNLRCLTQGIGQNGAFYSPILGYGQDGVAYIGGVFEDLGYETNFVGVEHSPDGIHWSKPVLALQAGSSAWDPWLTVDNNPGSPYLNSVYVSAAMFGAQYWSYRLYVSHSNDYGITWIPKPVAPGQLAPQTDAYTNMAVGKDGTVYVTWMYCVAEGSGVCGSKDTAYMVFSKSSDGGNTWSNPTSLATVALNNLDLPNSNVYIPDRPVIGADGSSGPYAGNLYVAMYNWTGTFMQVQVVHSTDGGTTWSKPVPVAPPSDNHDQFFPWLAVSQSGLVGVSWLDRRNDPNNVDYQAFAAISNDGGQSFQPNVQLTTAFSNPNDNGGSDFIGDYTGNTWDGPDYFLAAWMDNSNGADMQDVVGGIKLR